MAKTTTKLSAEDHVILFCAATGIDHAAVGILAHAMQSMAIRGFITHDRESGAYALTASGRAPPAAILGDADLREAKDPPAGTPARSRDSRAAPTCRSLARE